MKDNPEVLAIFDAYPAVIRDCLLAIRALIVDTAMVRDDIGTLEETLKWGQASYLTKRPKTGTTIRIDRDKSGAGDVALFVNCQSSLISDWRAMFPDLVFGGDRSVHFSVDTPLPEAAIRQMITMALTYHSAKRAAAKPRS
ncbi:DUF1801 domain-containing protein [Roseibium sp. LAB1]